MIRAILLAGLCLLSACSQKNLNKQIVRLNLYTEPPSLDSRLVTDITSVNVLLQLFEGLTRLDHEDQPQLAGANHIDISEDGLVYTVELREHFWSNGASVSVDDYVETWKEILDPLYPAPFAYKLFVIKNARAVKNAELPVDCVGIEKLDATHLRITLEHPAPYFLELLAFPTFYPVYRESVQKNPNWAAEAGPLFISNGPFRLESWTHNGEIHLLANPHYWDKEKVHLDRIEFCMIEDAITEFYMFEQGELDWCGSPLSQIPPEVAVKLNEEGRLHTYNTTGVYFLQLNTERYPLGNVKIRRALGLALNRRELIDHVYMIDHIVAQGLVPPLRSNPTPLISYQDAAYETAKRLFQEGLEEEGLDLNSFPILTISYNTCKQHQKVLQAIQQQWRDLFGIRVNLEAADWKVFLTEITQQNYDICRYGWVGEVQDPLTYLLLFKTTDPDGINHTGWHDDHYQTLVDNATIELNREMRAQYYREAEEILMEQMPIIPVCYLRFAYMVQPHIKGITPSKIGTIDLKQAWCE